MHLAIPFALLMGSLVAAAPSIQHAQISGEATPTDAENQAYALHSSEEHGPKNLPFNFTLSARPLNGDPQARLSFGFESLNVRDGFIRGELGFATEFAFHNGTLITGNRALGHHLNEPWPPWTSLWSLNTKTPDLFFDLIAISKLSEGKLHHFIEFVEHGKLILVASILICFIHTIFEGANW